MLCKKMKLFGRNKPLLIVSVAGQEICRVLQKEVPVEKQPICEILTENTVVTFTDANGRTITHTLGTDTGWFGFSIRVLPNFACQADCIFGADRNLSPERFTKGELSGIRFQPFFLGDAKDTERELIGHGLFQRGLHFSGTVTPGNVSLSCICDGCGRSFRLQSFHTGFSNCGYMYSGSGVHTLTIPDYVEGSPSALVEPDSDALRTLESMLPMAPDGTRFGYLNPLRCPHCFEPFIDFVKFPQDRKQEYYGNTFYGESALHYEPKATEV